MIQSVGTPILNFLVWMYDIIPNLGIGIIFLTVIINILMFPLVLKQTRATKAFQSIGPEIKKLQAKHKEEPEVLQKEMAALQRAAGANPLGCALPMLIQMPIWWALFRVLRSLGEQEGPDPDFLVPLGTNLASALADGKTVFLGVDLTVLPSQVYQTLAFSALLPYLLLILVMVAFQYFQQVLAQTNAATPQAENSQAQQMQIVTKVMPVMFGVFAWNFVAGLTLYWASSSIVRMLQQLLINRMDVTSPSTVAQEKTK
jgi:YidC/Oxa1 family membrane protein insertase